MLCCNFYVNKGNSMHLECLSPNEPIKFRMFPKCNQLQYFFLLPRCPIIKVAINQSMQSIINQAEIIYNVPWLELGAYILMFSEIRAIFSIIVIY